jgi:F-box and leucine-rich repeat protein GRR1
VNGWIYGEIIKTFTLIPPHGSDATNFDAVDVDFLVGVLALSCPKLEELNLSSCVRVTDKSMVLIAKNCPKLRKLNLNRCDLISSVSVSAIAEYCNELLVVNLSRPLLQQKTNISDESIFELVTKSKNLMELRLRNCELVTDRTVIALAMHNGNSLRALDLR